MRRVLSVILCLVIGGPAMAEGFTRVTNREAFVSLMNGRELTRFGITLRVTPDGRIGGRAFGRQVSGAWQWRQGYFCRDLSWGRIDLAPNCQAVRVQGRTVRFVSDRGEGQYADLRLR